MLQEQSTRDTNAFACFILSERIMQVRFTTLSCSAFWKKRESECEREQFRQFRIYCSQFLLPPAVNNVNALVICNADYYGALGRVLSKHWAETQDNKLPFHLWVIQGNKVFQFISEGGNKKVQPMELDTENKKLQKEQKGKTSLWTQCESQKASTISRMQTNGYIIKPVIQVLIAVLIRNSVRKHIYRNLNVNKMPYYGSKYVKLHTRVFRHPTNTLWPWFSSELH